MSQFSTSSLETPILYSFRRCPYAMRARLALLSAGIRVELREIELKNKPHEMLALSPKATVPVLQLCHGEVLDESMDIMLWALTQRDPACWLPESVEQRHIADGLIEQNDKGFKPWLDKYKYADRHPEQTAHIYRNEAEKFIQQLESKLVDQLYLLGSSLSLADVAIFPFIRQFAAVDQAWFAASNYRQVNRWLNELLELPLFAKAMKKYQPWQAGNAVVLFG